MAFLFPCTCGAEIPIEPRQAGEELTCTCGAKHVAPTMREIRQLPSTGEEAAPSRSRKWSAMQGALFSGGLALALIGASTLGVLLVNRSRLVTDALQVDQERVADHYNQWLDSPARSLQVWNELNELGLPPREQYTLPYEKQRVLHERNFWQCLVAAAILILGLMVAAAGILVPSPPQSTQPGATTPRATRPPPPEKSAKS